MSPVQTVDARAVELPVIQQYAVEQFLFFEAALLTEGRYDEWLTLFSEDVRYWMPTRETRANRADAVRSPGEMMVFDDDRTFMAVRVERMKSDMAHAEQPPSRLRYFVSNVRIERLDELMLKVRCNLMVHQTRMERMETTYVGEREDRFRIVGDTFSIVERKITLDHTMLPRAISFFF